MQTPPDDDEPLPPPPPDTFRFAPPPPPPGDDRLDMGVMVDVFTSDKAIVAAFGFLGLTLLFYLFVFFSGGITDGSERFADPVETFRTTLERDPDYASPSPRRWSPLSPLTYEEDVDIDGDQYKEFWGGSGRERNQGPR